MITAARVGAIRHATDKERVSMRVSVFGLGYVGAVSCGCFAHDGMDVVGVDVNPAKVEMIQAGRAPIVEERIGDMIADAVRAGRLRATTDVAAAVLATDVSVISVGTPSQENGRLHLGAVQRVSEQIGRALRDKPSRHLVVVRSTVMPGTVRDLVIPTLERESGTRAGDGFGICFNPEFLREGSSVRDHYKPPYTLIGSTHEQDARQAAALYAQVDAELYLTTIETAEMVKYVCNAFHALKITFANEMGLIAQGLGVDGHTVMDLVCRDTKLNISPKYLRPGFAFGGSCLPKDVRALLYQAREMDVEVPMTRAILESNRAQIDRAVRLVLQRGRPRVSMLGISFKAGTDDLRESPLVALAEALIGKGLAVRIYDSNVSLARLTGANKEYIEREIPHLASLLVEELPEAVAHGEVLLVGNNSPEFTDLPRLVGATEQRVIDLFGIPGLASLGDRYLGIAW
jgi:GDP-mannose 6-dehydrogenase